MKGYKKSVGLVYTTAVALPYTNFYLGVIASVNKLSKIIYLAKIEGDTYRDGQNRNIRQILSRVRVRSVNDLCCSNFRCYTLS